ncbi:MAG: hypothetical protein R2729_12810 [Bryobacteraceae bacterium]
MKARVAVMLMAGGLALPAQMRISVQQLVSFVKSSLQMRHDDRKLATYLKKVSLSERLDAATVEELQGLGAGPRTVEALEALRDATRDLKKAAAPPPKPARPVLAPPPREEQQRVLAEVRDYALGYTKRLPDFICTQVTRRYIDPSGLEFWQRQDVITTKLSFFEQKEDYKVVMVNSQPIDVDYERLGGAISAGEFGTMLKEIFEPESETEFSWSRWATLRGRRNHVYDYRVRQPRSKWRISFERSIDIVAGYHGQVFVDAQTNQVTRIRLEAENIPVTFPVQEASIELDYDRVPINDEPYMLPLKHTMRMRQGKMLVKNEVEFRMYRKFGADAVITFDTPEPLPEDQLTEQPPK